jgi:hypothetical protein
MTYDEEKIDACGYINLDGERHDYISAEMWERMRSAFAEMLDEKEEGETYGKAD